MLPEFNMRGSQNTVCTDIAHLYLTVCRIKDSALIIYDTAYLSNHTFSFFHGGCKSSMTLVNIFVGN